MKKFTLRIDEETEKNLEFLQVHYDNGNCDRSKNMTLVKIINDTYKKMEQKILHPSSEGE